MPPHFDLIHEYFDGELSPERQQELLGWLATNPEHVRVFVREAHLQSALREIAVGRLAHLEAESLARDFSRQRSPRVSRLDLLVSSVRRRFLWGFAIPIAILAFLVLMFKPSAQAWLVSSGAGVYVDRGTTTMPAAEKVSLRPGDVVGTEASSDAVL